MNPKPVTLAPCPWCGVVPRLILIDGQYNIICVARAPNDGPACVVRPFHVACDEARCISEWNTRAGVEGGKQ